jgi:hypothetical protein
MPNLSFRWRSRPDAAALEHTVDRLRTTVIELRAQLTNKEGYAATLERVLHQRHEQIDKLQSLLDRARLKNREAHEDAQHMATFDVARPPERSEEIESASPDRLNNG